MAYKPTRKFVTDDAIAIDYELRQIAIQMPTGSGSGTITGVTAGTAISGGGTTGAVTVNFAPSELSSVTVASDDKIVIADTSDSDNPKTVTASSIAALAPQGDITAVVAGTGLTGGGTAGSVQLDVSGLTVSEFAADSLQTSGESFADNDTSLMTSAAIQDKILSYGYITGVTNISGNAATATALQTARTIGGVSFDGTGNIDLAGVNTAGNQNTSGNAATATALETARTIGGVSFNGTANIDLAGVNTAGNQNTSGNAATATALATARAINGVNFDGTGDITVTAAAGTLTGTELKSTVVTSSLTSVGTLGSLTVSGAFTPATVTASTVTVAADDLVLITDTSDSANVKKVTAQSIADLGGGGGSPAGSDTQIQFNNGGSFGASANLTWDDTLVTINKEVTGGGAIESVLRLKGTDTDNSVNLVTGDGVGIEFWIPSDDSPYSFLGAKIGAEKRSDTDANEATGLVFMTTPNNGSPTRAMSILSDGSVVIGDNTTNGPKLQEGSADTLRIETGDGFIDIGSMNSSGAHFYAENANMYWGVNSTAEIVLDSNEFYPYVNNSTDLGKSGKAWNKLWLHQGSTFSSGGYWTLRSRDSDRQVMELTSSERFKKDIVDLPVEEAYQILDSRPILYRGIEDDASVPLEAGLSAESLHEAGYEYAVRYDEGHWGETPRAIYYEYLTAPIIKVLQDMQERITYLEDNQCQCQK